MIWSITINLLVCFFPKVDMSFDYKTMSIFSFFSIDDYKDKTIDNFGQLNFFRLSRDRKAIKKKNTEKLIKWYV